MTARFNPPVISVNGFDLRDEIPADIPLQVLVEKPFDIFTQFTLITLQVNQIIYSWSLVSGKVTENLIIILISNKK